MLGPVALPVALRSVRARAVAAVGATALGIAGLVGGVASTTTASAQVMPTPVCVLSTCVLDGTATTTTSSTSSSSSGLCILVLCNPTSGDGSGTTNTTSTTTSTSSSTCALTTCVLVNPTCSVQTDPTCLVSTSTSTTCTANCGGGGGGPGGNNGGGGGGGGGSHNTPTGTSSPRGASTFLALGGGGIGGGSGPTPGSSPVPFTGLSVATVPVVQTLSPVSGLQFGHAPILWPLFGALDLLGLVAVYLLVRRSRAAHSD